MSTGIKKTILVDFDGVIHEYSKGWHDGTAYDGPMQHAKESLEELNTKYRVVIFSTRSKDQIEEWLKKYKFPPYPVSNIKEPAICLIDDRAIRFTEWQNAMFQVDELYGL